MAYHHDRSSIRGAYDDHFPPMDSREVTVRVVTVEKRSSAPRQGSEYARGYDDNPQHNDRSNYSSNRGYYREDRFPSYDRRYVDDNTIYDSFPRNSSPQRNEGSYSQKYYDQNDLRHHLSSRNRARGHHPRQRGRGLGPPRENREDHRSSKSLVITRDRSPSREAQPPPRSRSTSSNRSFSPDREKNFSYQQQQQQKQSTEKTNVEKSQTPNSSAEGSPHSSVSSKEKTSASAAESAEPEEAVAASVEPTLTPKEDLKARRWEAINAKVLEIEKHYSQDCETFRTVVKMLVDKEPSLESLLQAPLDKNLLELRQRCLVALKSFVTELDEILALPRNSK